MKSLDLIYIQALIALKEEKTLVRAARRLGLSQPTLTRIFQQAEALAPAPLFEMRGRNKELTVFAEELAKKMKQRLEEMHAELSGLSTEFAVSEKLTLRIAGRIEILEHLLAELDYRGSLLLSPCPSAEALEKLKAREVDLAVSDRVLDSGNWIGRKILEDRFVLVVPSAWVKTAKTASEWLQSTADEKPFIEYNEALTRDMADGRRWQVSLSVNDWRMIVRRVNAGLGWSLIPASFARADAGYTVFPVRGGKDVKTFYISYRKELARIPAAKALIGAIAKRPNS